MDLIELAIYFRALNLYAHQAHNMVKGDEFFQDHAFFADLYSKFDDFYDQLIERHIGTIDSNVDLYEIVNKSATLLKGQSNDWCETIHLSLKNLLDKLEKYTKGCKRGGTINLIQGMQDEIEIILYKLQQRMDKEEENGNEKY